MMRDENASGQRHAFDPESVGRMFIGLMQAMVQAEVQAVAAPTAPPAVADTRLRTKREIAHLLGVSGATIDRFVREVEGMPFVPVGASKRFDVAACRAWLARRGARPTKAAPRAVEDDPIDVSAVMRRGGLRAVGGGR